MIQADPARFYVDGDYARLNPTWDSEDAAWKADLVATLLASHGLLPSRLVEVGCGSGAVLAHLRSRLPQARLEGFDIAPGASRFWPAHESRRLHLEVGDFLAIASEPADVLLLLDVFEHVANPHDFLSRLRGRASHFIFHVPLDLSVASVWRERPLLNQRRGVGHIHYYTKGLALELLGECGYDILEARFSGAHLRARHTLGGKLVSLARRAVFALGRERGVRLVGGDTLLVLARAVQVPAQLKVNA
jgi:SAM-dependent methyltransferase